jgi:hypothetical protein
MRPFGLRYRRFDVFRRQEAAQEDPQAQVPQDAKKDEMGAHAQVAALESPPAHFAGGVSVSGSCHE